MQLVHIAQRYPFPYVQNDGVCEGLSSATPENFKTFVILCRNIGKNDSEIQKQKGAIMKPDLELVVHKFPKTLPCMNLYPVGDAQFGSAGFDEGLWDRWKKMALDDPYGYVVFIGDMVNNGLKNSRTNVYREVASPQEQKEWLDRQVEDLADIFLGAVTGNHELRTVDSVGTDPLYDVMDKWGLDDYYRENMLFMKLNLGDKGGGKQASYTLALHHGGSDAKMKVFGYSLENCDFLISGHIHQPKSNFPARYVVDTHNETVRKLPFRNIVVPSFDSAGYVIRGAFPPQSNNIIPIIKLHGEKKAIGVSWIEI